MKNETAVKRDKKFSEEFKKELRRIVLELLLLLSLLLIVFTGICIKEYLDKHFTHFNAERTALMEEIFDIRVDDSVKLIRYEDDSILAAIYEKLELETDNYERFMSENVNAVLEPDESCNDRSFLLYNYKDESKDLKVESQANGKYLITLTHWD
ncbi:hypothetical protein [Ruminococcus flavefaciens]|uniref:Uncharacterized protein n=1 Tax=Ruminococcus flavefaciens 007c TaxID=1341157 RepID=W7UNU7_RUMFL|nr:hypothetical protein [Ruminococcus flavefaciens]EWM53129.1 hypothetical protein RF007C_16080 [Ruminococcus flavefaciens 007c]